VSTIVLSVCRNAERAAPSESEACRADLADVGVHAQPDPAE
jgi:hypothetical protein